MFESGSVLVWFLSDVYAYKCVFCDDNTTKTSRIGQSRGRFVVVARSDFRNVDRSDVEDLISGAAVSTDECACAFIYIIDILCTLLARASYYTVHLITVSPRSHCPVFQIALKTQLAPHEAPRLSPSPNGLGLLGTRQAGPRPNRSAPESTRRRAMARSDDG